MSADETNPTPHQPSGYIEPPPLHPTEEGSGAQAVDLSSGNANIKFDQLGPLVVNSNGTLSRIDNWSSMTAVERERTLRILGKRNQLRVKNLQEGQGADNGASVPPQ